MNKHVCADELKQKNVPGIELGVVAANKAWNLQLELNINIRDERPHKSDIAG